MRRALAAALSGVIVGVAGTLLVIHDGMAPRRGSTQPVRDLDDVPKMTEAAAVSHRQNRYANLHSVEDVLALPSDFAQTDALYAVAGRSDSSAVQRLVFEAVRIRDDRDRDAALHILFARLTELDPRSALALARSADVTNDPGIEARVWRSWGKHDLDAALDAARAQPRRIRARAAQSLLSAFRTAGCNRYCR